jgi:riboflavin kinase/FMN adenylyltransferase
LSSCDFIEQYLVKKVRLHKLIVGYNHKFGHNREGGFENLKECAGKYNFEIQRLEPAFVGREKISSSIIRELLLKGELDLANNFLGYDFFLNGSVIEGNKIGRQIGFPTANIQPSDEHKLIPKPGVYAVHLEKDGLIYKGMLNIGFRPTLNSEMDQKSIEVHLFDFNDDIYSQEVKLHFRYYMREEKKFGSLEQLKDQLVIDRRRAIEVLQ